MRILGPWAVTLHIIAAAVASAQSVAAPESPTFTTIKARHVSGEVDVTLAIVPATVNAVGGSKPVPGWFTVVADPKLGQFWWGFSRTSVPAPKGTSIVSPATDFVRRFVVYSKPDALTVFLPTSTHIYIGVAKDSYSSDAALGGLAQAAFNGRAVSLARGTDYFDSSLDLHKAFGKAFFGDPLRSDSSADPITIRSLSWLDDRWEIVVEGEKDLGVITLAADFEIRDFVRMVR